MKKFKITYLLFAVLIAFAGCKKEKPFCEKVADGYVFTVNKAFYDKLPESADNYGITFMELNDSKVDAAILKKLFSDPTKFGTIEGSMKKTGNNQFIIVTGQKLIVDPMIQKYGVLWGVNAARLSQLIGGGFGECKDGTRGSCHSICDMLGCACENPNCQYACCGC